MDRRRERLPSSSSMAPLLRCNTTSTELIKTNETEIRTSTASESTLESQSIDDESSSYADVRGNNDTKSLYDSIGPVAYIDQETVEAKRNKGYLEKGNSDVSLLEVETDPPYGIVLDGFEQYTKDNQALQKNYKSLKKMFYCVTVLCLILVVTVLALLVSKLIVFPRTCFDNEPHSPGLTDEQIQQRIAELTEQLGNYKTTCIECTVLGELLGNEEFWNQVSVDQSGQCCVKDPAGLFERLIEKTEELSPMVNQVLDELKVIVKALKANVTERNSALTESVQNLENVNSLQMWGQNRRDQKGAVHLEGSFHATDRQIVWTNRAASSSILLTKDSKNVIIANAGNYFIYARVKFHTTQLRDNRPLAYKIYQRTKHGNVRVLEEVQHQPEPGSTFDTACTMHRVAQFNEGDQVYLYISGASLLSVAKGNVHEFGMFEI